MRARILVGIICIPVLFSVLWFLPSIATGAAVGIIAAISAYELRRALGAKRAQIDAIYAALAGLVPIFASTTYSAQMMTIFSFLALATVTVEAVWRYEKGENVTVATIFGSVFAVCVIPIALSCVCLLRGGGAVGSQPYATTLGRLYVFLPFLSAFITDAGAYFVGIFFGKRKIFPRVSPKKTLAGCVGGTVTGVLSVVLFGLLGKLQIGVPALVIIGLVGSVFTIIGDLAFSLIKRSAGIKDYGNLLPGHGGMLDRFDSLVFAAPAVYLVVQSLPTFGAI